MIGLGSFARTWGILYNAVMLTYVCIIAFVLFGYIWLQAIVFRREKARFARRRQWRAWILGELTKAPPESEDKDKPGAQIL